MRDGITMVFGNQNGLNVDRGRESGTCKLSNPFESRVPHVCVCVCKRGENDMEKAVINKASQRSLSDR